MESVILHWVKGISHTRTCYKTHQSANSIDGVDAKHTAASKIIAAKMATMVSDWSLLAERIDQIHYSERLAAALQLE